MKSLAGYKHFPAPSCSLCVIYMHANFPSRLDMTPVLKTLKARLNSSLNQSEERAIGPT